MTEQELINQNNETFREEGSDAWKLKGKIRSAEVRAFNISIFTWVKSLLLGKSDTGHGHTIGEVDNLQTTLNSHNQRITNNAFTTILENQFNTHPAFASQHAFNVWVLQNTGATTPPDPSNQPPTVNAGADQTVTEGVTVQLTGTASDADGSIATYAWSKVSGGAAAITTPNAASTTVTGLTEGVYVFRLTVTDNLGATAFDEMTITVTVAALPTPALTISNITTQSVDYTITEQ